MLFEDIGHSWSVIEAWMRDRGEARKLPPPATAKELAEVEERLGARLPEELAESLRCHNGSGLFRLPPIFEMLGTTGLVNCWAVKVQVWADARHVLYAPSWIPFASDGAGGVLYLDAAADASPAIHEHGKLGASPLTPHPMWQSLTALLHHTAEALVSGASLDGYTRPGDDDWLMHWQDTEDEEAE